ncbi:MAG: asparagine synthase C-terminal domain-containing protein [Nitrospirales bacterium]|nr:hypothetical protein [Nitrospira sp.]MDR4501908.1 asparagine synthase C-terminal domain-containing protein [Nitrospirales bacterium]
MSGICGIAWAERSDVDGPQCLRSMMHDLAPSSSAQEGQMQYGETVGFGAQAFPGRMSGAAQLREQGNTHLIGFHGSLYNLDEILADHEEYEDPLVAILSRSLRGMKPLLSALRGEFVISVWDANQETLFLACDRFRVHPLFFMQDHQSVAFASRMRSLFSCPSARNLSINPCAIIDVISSSFIPSPRTIFELVQKLEPGQLLSWNRGKCQVEPYWDLTYQPAKTVSQADLSEKLRTIFSDSVRVRMKHDQNLGEIGSFLSGGIDSSTVLGVLTQLAQAPMPCFSIGFGEEVFNEASFARCAAKAFGANQHELTVTAQDTYDVIDRLVESFDEPYANASSIPTFYCAQLAKEHGVSVLYGGDGGDELFAGNERYATQKVFDYYHMVPRWLRDGGIQPVVFALSKLLPLSLFVKGRKYIQRANVPYPDRLLSWGLFELFPMQEVFSGELLQSVGETYDPHHRIRELYSHSRGVADSELDRQLYLDLKLAISDNDLFKVTRMTEANGVAVRFPFLDHHLAEFAACIPDSIKMKGVQLRTFFKNAYADMLPEEIRTKTKHGFGLPIPIWLRTDKRLRELMMDVLLSNIVQQRGYFRHDTIDRLIKRHNEDTTSFFGTILWNFVMLELWLRRYRDKN